MSEDFLKDMKDIFIPSIERMIVKETEHIAGLEAKRGGGIRNNRLNKYIGQSNVMLIHYKQRLREYEDYLSKHTKTINQS